MENFASEDEEEEVSSDEEADSEANQPNDMAAGVALRTQRGAAAAWYRRNNGVETEEEKRRMHINRNKAAHFQSRHTLRRGSIRRETSPMTATLQRRAI